LRRPEIGGPTGRSGARDAVEMADNPALAPAARFRQASEPPDRQQTNGPHPEGSQTDA
jgi:hypothetical protein